MPGFTHFGFKRVWVYMAFANAEAQIFGGKIERHRKAYLQCRHYEYRDKSHLHERLWKSEHEKRSL